MTWKESEDKWFEEGDEMTYYAEYLQSGKGSHGSWREIGQFPTEEEAVEAAQVWQEQVEGCEVRVRHYERGWVNDWEAA